MNRFYKIYPLFLIYLMLFAGIATTVQSAEPTINELEQQIKLRDEAIIELLERVDALEQRTGVQRSNRPSTKASDKSSNESSQEKPAQAPGTVVVDEADAERALERSLTVEGALLLPAGVVELEPGFSYARREDSTPSFTTIGSNVFPSETEVNANIYTASLSLRWGLPWQSQLEIGQSYREINAESNTVINFEPTSSRKQTTTDRGDLRIGFAKTLLREGLSQPDLVGRITWDSDSGSNDSFDELQLSLTAIKRQDPVTFIGGLSYQHAFEKHDIEPGTTVSTNLGALIALNPETSLRFLFSAAFQDETKQSGQEIDASDRTAASFITGGSTLLARGVLLNLSVGIGLTDDADDFSIGLSLPVRFN